VELLADRVSVLVPALGLGEKETDAPLGRPEPTVRLTGPENPKCGIMLMVSLADAPGATVRNVADGEREKLCVAVTVRNIIAAVF